MVKPHRERILYSQRASKPYAPKHRKLGPPFQQQPDDLQEVLVPTYGDAILSHSAKPGHHPLIQILGNLLQITNGLEGAALSPGIHARVVLRQGLNLQPVHCHYGVTVVHQMMRQRIACRAQAHHQRLVARCGLGKPSRKVQRIPSRQEAVDLEPPGQFKYVLQGARFGLRDIHRVLLLINASLHAVVADTMPGTRHQRVIHRHDAQSGNWVALVHRHVHFGDFLL